MKASLNWIKELLPTLSASAESIEQRLTAAGIEVEETIRQADGYPGVVTAEIMKMRPHPDADRLRLATVFDGTDEIEVVCGAANAEAGQKVAFAPSSTTLPNGMRIESRQVRGVTSAGMICSLAELGLAADADGIIVLAKRTRPGKPIARYIGRTDVVFEVGVTPNRPDALSHFGLARELAAIHRLPLPVRRISVDETGEPASTRARVEIRRGQRCPRYVGRVVEGVRVGPSPDWVVQRLEAIGLRSISNVVDATNIALFELGHPLHAFDLDKLGGRRIVVRLAKEDETLTTLDGEARKLDPDDLVIADAKIPVALAGVMGGAGSEVTGETTDILLESAMFDPRSVRRTSKRHGLHTEASHRFERGADPGCVDLAIDRCAQLICELAGGRVLPGRLEAVKREATSPVVPIRPARASLLLGRAVGRKEVREALTALGLKKVNAPKDDERRPRKDKARARKKEPLSGAMWFSVPSWRVDLEREEDLIEEVARMTGYDAIPTEMPNLPPDAWTEGLPFDDSEIVRATLVGEGFFEAISLAFNSVAQLEAMRIESALGVRLANPIGEESSLMRMSLLPALLRSARLNQSHSRIDLRLFEIGQTFAWTDPPDALPQESPRVALLMRGRRAPAGWANGRELVDEYDLKGALEALLSAFRIEGARWTAGEAETPWLHPRSATRIEVGPDTLGWMGALHPDVMQGFELEGPPCFVAELDLAALVSARGPQAVFAALPRFPAVTRDLSFYIDRAVEAASIVETVRGSEDTGTLEDASIFDVYDGKGLPEGKRSVAIALTFRSRERTLTDDEVDAAQNGIMAALESRLGAEIRRGP